MTTENDWKIALMVAVALAVSGVASAASLDQNNNSLNDVWEISYGAAALAAAEDTDQDGFSNAQESVAGTDPFDPASHPVFHIAQATAGRLQFDWPSIPGKRYWLVSRPEAGFGAWTTNASVVSVAYDTTIDFTPGTGMEFFSLITGDTDSDGDGLNDAEERALGLNPFSGRTDRQDVLDLQRVTNGLANASIVTIATLDPILSERWPDPGLIAVRRKNGLKPITVALAFGGTATKGVDYLANVETNIFIPMGVREVWIEVHPLIDSEDNEPDETVTITVLAGTGYSVGASNTALVTVQNETLESPPSAKAAARFLLQAAFGPNQDSPLDSDLVPENVAEVVASGFEGWIDEQFARPEGWLQPGVEWIALNGDALEIYGNWKEFSWWSRAMGAPKLRPDSPTNTVADPLRQRVAFALSQILVASDRPEQLAVEQVGMANFYDLFVRHAFGNYRDLLHAVALHPVMGIYLSHLGNRKADPVNKIYPDENFAREIMQLFSIGLWELNPDGTRRLGTDGQPIATYDNGDITELARVFTGLSFGNNENFALYPRDTAVPMKMWDAEHDCNPKTLLRGLSLPSRTPSPGNAGVAGMADVDAAVSNLWAHPNVGPFVGRQLIQRLVTSNPSTGYVGRVAAAFADNGSGVRGDLKAVIKAILLDTEARDPQHLQQPTWGKLREPFLRVVNLATAFNAASSSGHYPLDQFTLDHQQDPMSAPSVFNFFLPTHSPPGRLTELGLVAPEFQIINASSAITGPNYFWNAIPGGLHRYGTANPNYSVQLNLTNELAMVAPAGQLSEDVPAGPALDPDPLLRRLDLVLTGGTLSPPQFQIIRETMERINPPTWQWHRERLRLAIYLIVTSADYNVLR